MPVVKETELYPAQKKRLFEEMKFELSLCETDEDIENFKNEFEQEIKQITENGEDEEWMQVIEEEIEIRTKIIKLKQQEKRICQ